MFPKQKRKVFYEEETCFGLDDVGRIFAFCGGKDFSVFTDYRRFAVQHYDIGNLRHGF